APDVCGQLAGPPARLGSLRDRGRLEKQPVARAAHARRGLAQQPPPLPVVLDLRILLVGARPDLLGPQGAERHRAHLGSAGAAADGARQLCAASRRSGECSVRRGLLGGRWLERLYGGALDAREDILSFYRRCEEEGGFVRTHIWRLPVCIVTA